MSNLGIASRQTRRTPDTRFGMWFQSSEIWRRYVVEVALDEFERLLGSAASQFGVVLDAGCGAGRAFGGIETRFRPRRIVAVDADPKQLARARQELQHCSCRVDLLCGDLRDLSLPDSSIDLVVCHQTLHHAAEQSGVLREFFRVLRPGGTLLLAESCRRFVRSLPVRLLFRHPMRVQQPPEGYLALLRDSGFRFDRSGISNPDPFWSRPDFGVRERLGMQVAMSREPSELQVVAVRP